MGQDHIRYDILAQDALRGVIRKVLGEVAATGRLPGDHHFFITFLTGAPGVRISQHLKSKYAEQMTIVIQHQFWDLKVTEIGFEIGLSFSDTPEKLVVPYNAIRGFYDPSVNFELEFDVPRQTRKSWKRPKSPPIPFPMRQSRLQRRRRPSPARKRRKAPSFLWMPSARSNNGFCPTARSSRRHIRMAADIVNLRQFRKQKPVAKRKTGGSEPPVFRSHQSGKTSHRP